MGGAIDVPCVDYARAATIIGGEMQVLRLELLPGHGVRTGPLSMKWCGPEIELDTTGWIQPVTEYHCTGAAPAAITLVRSVQP